jgi:hypoxanthine phosphoribosyltransferase
MIPSDFSLLYSQTQILSRIQEIGKQISQDFKNKPFLAIGLLKGCTVFMSHLLVQIQADVEIDFMTISSYKDSTQSENFKLLQDLSTSVANKHILIIEDIIDTGQTIKFVTEHLRRQGAASIEVATFVHKTSNLQHEIPTPKYIGFNYSHSEFLVGFGFDLAEKHRNLPAVYRINHK